MIVKGDTGIALKLQIVEDDQPVDLTGANVVVIFKNGDHRVEKNASITDAETGLCEAVIDAADTSETGVLDYQVRVITGNGSRYSAPMEYIPIADDL